MKEEAMHMALAAILGIAQDIRGRALPGDLTDEIDLIISIAKTSIREQDDDTNGGEHHDGDGTGFPMPE